MFWLPNVPLTRPSSLQTGLFSVSAAVTDLHPSANSEERVGPYQLSKLLGHGSFATVKLGIHLVSGQQVAVKLISKRHASRPSVRSIRSQHRYGRIEREINALRRLNHPNITRLLDVQETSQFYALVLEYVPGGDLHDLLTNSFRRRLDLRYGASGITSTRAFEIFYQLVSALASCHACNVAHRDIKLENILVDKFTGQVKLSDFGLANLIEDRTERLMMTSCGSPHYVAPEIVRGERYSGAAADVWALGVVLYALHAGRLPFVGLNSRDLLEKICHGEYAVPVHFGPELRNLITRMFHPNFRNRIRIPQIKKHPWWIQCCAKYGLEPAGVPPVAILRDYVAPLNKPSAAEKPEDRFQPGPQTAVMVQQGLPTENYVPMSKDTVQQQKPTTKFRRLLRVRHTVKLAKTAAKIQALGRRVLSVFRSPTVL